MVPQAFFLILGKEEGLILLPFIYHDQTPKKDP